MPAKSMPVLPIVTLVIGLIAGFLIFYLAGNALGIASAGTGSSISKDAISQKVKAALELGTQSAVTVSEVIEKNGLYKVIVSSNGQMTEVYATRDGSLLFQSPIEIDSYTTMMGARKAWFDCLQQKGLKFYGSTAVNETLAQIQLLGGTSYMDRIYVSCDGTALQACLDRNITMVPYFEMGSQNWTGVKTGDWVANTTGCAA